MSLIPDNYRPLAAKILNVIMLGTFTPFMISILKEKKRGVMFFCLNWLAVGLVAASPTKDQGPTTLWIYRSLGVVLWLGILYQSFKIAARAKRSTHEEKTAPADLPAEIVKESKTEKSSSQKFRENLHKPFMDQMRDFFSYLFIGHRKLARLRRLVDYKEGTISKMEDAKSAFLNFSKTLELAAVDEKTEHEIIDISGCSLIEPRKGARVTERTSTSSGRGYAGVRVGRVYVGGSGGSTSSSRSVSYPAPDVLTQTDSGRFKMTTHRVSFAGSMFTKSSEYKKLIDFNSQGNSLLFAPQTGSKVWIIEFPSVEYAWAASAILSVVMDAEPRIIDVKAKKDGVLVGDLIQSNFRSKVVEIDFGIDEERKSIVELRGTIKDLETRYGVN